jgi:alpha-galactosidase
MKKLIIFVLLFVCGQMVKAEQIVLQTKNTTMVLNVENDKQPQYVYYGAKLSDYDLQTLPRPHGGRMDAYPAYGMNCPAEAAFAMTHADGNMSTSLVITGFDKQDGELRIHMKDPVYPTTVDL